MEDLRAVRFYYNEKSTVKGSKPFNKNALESIYGDKPFGSLGEIGLSGECLKFS